MSTRALIAANTSLPFDGRSVYLHHGYGRKPLLDGHYSTVEAVDALIAGGDLSILGETVETCRYYGRDMGATRVPPRAYANEAALAARACYAGVDFVYLWSPPGKGVDGHEPGGWRVGRVTEEAVEWDTAAAAAAADGLSPAGFSDTDAGGYQGGFLHGGDEEPSDAYEVSESRGLRAGDFIYVRGRWSRVISRDEMVYLGVDVPRLGEPGKTDPEVMPVYPLDRFRVRVPRRNPPPRD